MLALASCASGKRAERDFVVGMHAVVTSEGAGELLLAEIPQLSAMGVNLVVAEVGYAYEWTSHPELTYPDPLTFETARAIGDACRANGIDIVPLVNCVGHQSWEGADDILLEAYPGFDETPGLYPDNEGIYCRSWCVSNPDVYPIVFDLVDELTEAFGAKGVHVGMDEVFLIGEDACPRCRGRDRAVLFAEAANRLHDHIVREKRMTMYLWGDRLLDYADLGAVYDENEYEVAANGTSGAIDLIPDDIVVCDWHYARHADYPSLDRFLERGFRVLSVSFEDPDAASAFVRATLARGGDPRMLGHLYTNWGETTNDRLHAWPPALRTIGRLRY